MAPSNPLISQDQLQAALGAIQALPVVEPQGLSKAEAIQSMRPALEDALRNRGYTYDQLADVLTRQNIKITETTLREYLRAKPVLTYKALLKLAESTITLDDLGDGKPMPTLAGIKKAVPKLTGLSAKQIAEAMTASGFTVTTAKVSALMRKGA